MEYKWILFESLGIILPNHFLASVRRAISLQYSSSGHDSISLPYLSISPIFSLSSQTGYSFLTHVALLCVKASNNNLSTPAPIHPPSFLSQPIPQLVPGLC